MPIIKSAKKKLRQDKKKTVQNKRRETAFRKAVKAAMTGGKKSASLNKVFSTIDRAVAKRLIHKNKAARLKSRLAKRFKKVHPKKAK